MRDADRLTLRGVIGAAGQHHVHHTRGADKARQAHRAATIHINNFQSPFIDYTCTTNQNGCITVLTSNPANFQPLVAVGAATPLQVNGLLPAYVAITIARGRWSRLQTA